MSDSKMYHIFNILIFELQIEEELNAHLDTEAVDPAVDDKVSEANSSDWSQSPSITDDEDYPEEEEDDEEEDGEDEDDEEKVEKGA